MSCRILASGCSLAQHVGRKVRKWDEGPNRARFANGPVYLAYHAGHMPHLAARAGLTLAVDMEMGAALCDQLGPAIDVVSDEVVHRRTAAGEASHAGRQITNRADVLLKLGRDRALYRPMAAVVNARRDFVDQRALGAREELDREHSDMSERFGDAERRFARLTNLRGYGVPAGYR